MNLVQHKLKILVILPLVSSIVLGFGIYQLFYAPSQNFGGSIALAWSPMQQDIVNGTLWINATWTWQTENLSLTVKINDDDFNPYDFVGLAFDKDRDGQILSYPPSEDGIASCFMANNYSRSGILGESYIGFFYLEPVPSKRHICKYIDGEGYEFRFNLPKSFYKINSPVLMHICYSDEDYSKKHFVSAEFEV